MKFRGLYFIFILIFPIFAFSFTACNDNGGCAGLFKGDKGKGVPVMVERVRVREESPIVTVTGKLIPNEKADISYPNDVKIQEVYVSVGDTVLTGDPLFRLAEDDMTNELNLARARQVELDTQLDKNRNLLTSRGQLLEEGKVEQDEISRLEKEIAVQAAELERVKANIAKLNHNLENVVVNSPGSGIVTRQEINSGSTAKAGQIVIRVVNTNPIIISLPIEVKQLEDISLGTILDVLVNALPNKKFEANVTYINPELNRTGKTFDIRATIPNDDFLLKSGMSASIEFKSDTLKHTYLIPMSAVLSRASRPYVYKVGKGVAHKTPITIGAIYGQQAEVVSGLEGGDIVVVKGGEELYDGSDVSIWR